MDSVPSETRIGASFLGNGMRRFDSLTNPAMQPSFDIIIATVSVLRIGTNR